MLVEGRPPPPPGVPVEVGIELSVAEAVALPIGTVLLPPAPPVGGPPSTAVVKPEYEPVD